MRNCLNTSPILLLCLLLPILTTSAQQKPLKPGHNHPPRQHPAPQRHGNDIPHGGRQRPREDVAEEGVEDDVDEHGLGGRHECGVGGEVVCGGCDAEEEEGGLVFFFFVGGRW